MQTALMAAAVLAFLVGALHSTLGEVLIFRRMRQGTLVPTHGRPVLHERHVRILWASWHVLTLFGWAMAAMLLHLSAAGAPSPRFFLNCIAAAMLGGALLVYSRRTAAIRAGSGYRWSRC